MPQEFGMKFVKSVINWRQLAAGLLVSGIVCSAGAQAQAGETLSGRDIQKFFHGRFTGVVSGFVKVRFVASRNGALTGIANGKKNRGTWSIRGSRLCIAIENWRGGRKQCSRVRRSGNWYKASSVSFRKL